MRFNAVMLLVAFLHAASGQAAATAAAPPQPPAGQPPSPPPALPENGSPATSDGHDHGDGVSQATHNAVAAMQASSEYGRGIAYSVYNNRDCSGSPSFTGRTDAGQCRRISDAEIAAYNAPAGVPISVGIRRKRHCLCGDRVFLEGATIPDWGTRTCNADELNWACADRAVVEGDDAYNGRQHMIQHCCDAAQENSHYEWTACSVSTEATSMSPRERWNA